MHLTIRVALAALAGLLAPLSARAAESFDNCKGFIDALPATIATQGVWCLRKDVSTAIASGAAITVATNNVTIDCNGYKVGGLAAGSATQAYGVFADGAHNIVVRNCNVRGFAEGIHLSGNGQRVERNRLESNTYAGIWIEGDGNLVRGNQVLDTGGRPGERYALGIVALGESPRALDNDIHGVQPDGDSEGAAIPFGIDVQRAGIVRNNRITGLVPGGGAPAIGMNLTRGIAWGNTIIAPANTVGNGIQHAAPGVCHDNVIVGYTTTTLGCTAGNNSPAE